MGVKKALPTTGTSQLLEQLSPYIPDEFINQQWPDGPTGGRRRTFSAAQLWRTHLLLLLTPAHSINLLVKLLKEQRSWRRFARLSHRQGVPDVRMLHEFRAHMGVSTLRTINEQLMKPLLREMMERLDTIAIIDATDLPAACKLFKKRAPAPTQPNARQ
ncbi:MAG TPA: transposase [Scandinavium sp.]